MTDKTWTATTGNTYTATAAWSGASVPTTNDDVYINIGAASPYTISFNTTSAILDSVQLDDANATFNFNGTTTRTLRVTGTGTLSGSVVLTLGTIAFTATSGAQTVSSNIFTQAGGSVAASTTGVNGIVNAANSATLSGGAFSIGSAGQFNVGGGAGAAGQAKIAGTGAETIIGGSLTANTFTISAGTFTQSAGGVSLTALATFGGGTDTFSGTALFQAGTVDINTALSINGGTVQSETTGGIVIASSTVVTMSTGTLDGTGGTAGGIANSGTITGKGELLGAITGSGLDLASGGTLEIASAQSNGSPTFQIAASSALQFDATASGDTVTYNSTSSGDLALNGDSTTFTDTIAAMNVGSSATVPTDYIDVLGVAGLTITNGGTVASSATTSDNITLSNGATLALTGVVNTTSPWFAKAISDGNGGTEIFLNNIVCYAEGTLIQTDSGEIPVESLAAGDRVVTLQNGEPVPMPIKWMGVRHLDLASHPRRYTAAPVRIRAGAFGHDLPRRDLLVSPAHCIYVDGKLVPANLLINHMTIVQDLHANSVTYYHVELDRHALILAEGLTSESYLDTGNRAYFANAGVAMVLHPEFHVNAGLKTWEQDACAPLAIDAETVAPIWHDLATRAEAMGYVPPSVTTTAEPDLYVEANGRRLRPVAIANGRHSFMIPAGAQNLTLRSRATAPADLLPLSGDWRPLGVAVRGMTLRNGDNMIAIPADHPSLTTGWHTAETANGSLWRWTAGAAVLPLPPLDRAAMLDIDVASMGTYILARSDAEARLAA